MTKGNVLIKQIFPVKNIDVRFLPIYALQPSIQIHKKGGAPLIDNKFGTSIFNVYIFMWKVLMCVCVCVCV